MGRKHFYETGKYTYTAVPVLKVKILFTVTFCGLCLLQYCLLPVRVIVVVEIYSSIFILVGAVFNQKKYRYQEK